MTRDTDIAALLSVARQIMTAAGRAALDRPRPRCCRKRRSSVRPMNVQRYDDGRLTPDPNRSRQLLIELVECGAAWA